MSPNPHIALIYHYDLARALNGEPVDWQAIPVNVDAGREGGDLCRAAADFAKRRDLFAMVAPSIPNKLGEVRVPGEHELEPDMTLAELAERYKVAVPAAPNAVGQPVAEPEPPVPAQDAAQGSAANFNIRTVAAYIPMTAEVWREMGGTVAPIDRDRLRARIADLIDQGHEQTIRRHWPPDVAPLSRPGHTDAELAAILAAVRRVETEVGAGWHPDDGPPPHVNTDPRAVDEYPAQPGEGGPATAADLNELQVAFDALTDDQRELCRQVATEAHDAGRSISVSAHPTLRRYSLARAVIAWAASGRSVDDLWFTASLLATFEQCKQGDTLGSLISQFDIAQADRLYDAATAAPDPL